MSCMFCGEPAENWISIRCRKPDDPGPNAPWAPDYKEARLCKEHAEGGVVIEMTIEPAVTHQVNTTISSGGRQVMQRTTDIVNSAA